MRYHKIFIITIVTLYSCSEENKDHFTHTRINKPPVTTLQHLAFDTVNLDLPTTSYVGVFQMYGDKLFFVDHIYCMINELDLEGNFKSHHLGKGNGPLEIPRLSDFLATSEGYIATHDWSFYVYDTSWTLKKKFVTNWNDKASNDLLANPDPRNMGMYETQYYGNVLRYNKSKEELITKVVTEHQTYNAFTTAGFYKDSRVMGSININKGSIASVFGRFSPVYEQYQYIPFHSFMDYDLTDQKFYVVYEPDSLIYVFDTDYKPLYAFGNAGKNISLKFTETNQLEVFEDIEANQKAREEDGYYQSIRAFDETGVVFRKYQQDGGAQRMQIYKDLQLIGDVAVSKTFRVIGFRAPYYYAEEIIDEENEKLAFVKFKIE